MKKRVLRAVRAAVFCAVLAALVLGASTLLERKESREKLEPFFARAQQTDVLLLGDSHMLSAVYPMEMWRDYGITCYNLASYNNTMPLSYWVLRCALDVCSPKAVVVDINYIGHYARLGGSSADAHTTLDGFPLSRTKLAAIDDLMDDPDAMDDYGNRYRELKSEFIFPLALYHSRWESISQRDFHPELNTQLGAQMVINVAEPAEYDIVADAGSGEGIGYAYLRRLVALCRERGIDVLLTNVPYPPAGEEDQLHANAVYDLALELDVPYIDFVYMDQIVDYMTDCYDANSHMNPSGARKVTDYLGAYLASEFGVPDHRAEPAYTRWADDYAAYAQEKVQLLREQTGIENLLMLLHDPDFSVCLSIPAGSGVYGDERLVRLLQNTARRHLYERDADEGIFADGLMPLERMEEADERGEPYLAVIDRKSGAVLEYVGEDAQLDAGFGCVRCDETELTVEAGGNGESRHADAQKLCVAVIDGRTDEIVMVREFSL